MKSLCYAGFALFLALILTSLTACGGAQTPDLSNTAGLSTPRNLWEIRDPFRVKPASGMAYLLEIKPISSGELPASLDNRDILIFAAYHFTNGQEGKTVVLPVLGESTPSLEGFTLDTNIEYFQIYAVESQITTQFSIFEDAGHAMRNLCLATPNCQ